MIKKVSPAFLDCESSLKLIFFGGKGGVGKTTCACATALQLAEGKPDKQFLLVSTDPAHSLRGAFADLTLPNNLEILELDAAVSLHDFKAKHDQVLKEIGERGTFLDDEDLQGLMDLSLPGMDELAAYLEIADWLQQDRYHCIVIDTAPTGHTLRLLEMPDLIRRWLVGLDTLLAKHRYIRRHFTGDSGLDHLDRFLLTMSDSLTAIEKLMSDQELCRFVIVMLAELMSVEESFDLANALKGRKIPLLEMVVNQLIPANDCPTCSARRKRQMFALKGALVHMREQQFWTLPLFPEEPRGKAIASLWSQTQPLEQICVLSKSSFELPLKVEYPIPLPARSVKLLIFCGKGGVGKTTMACATALRLHKQYPSLRVLLFSSDPAHSLADCLGLVVKGKPTQILLGLDAQEINAEGAFDKVRQEYRDELEGFLAVALPRIDITFDREVMEHLLDIAPPGLDEIMALTSVMDHLDGGCYDVVVMDSAPSGHLIRLLELPELIGGWLKQFFSLLLKYRHVMRLPKLSQRLVDLSRKLKALRALLSDRDKTSLYAVTIPTNLAMEKTAEMMVSLHQLGISSKGLFINQITPTNDCKLCHAINQREDYQIKQASEILFTGQPLAKVFLQFNSDGLERLQALGSVLYVP
ncbi:MAG: ArsA family ATPase [Candidatus Methylumidiphilus sp.]